MSGTRKNYGFFKDITGASRVTNTRKEKFKNASSVLDSKDSIRVLAEKLHPAKMQFQVISVKDVSPTSRTFRLTTPDGHIPVFQCGQYVNLHFKIGDSILNRPYSISSAPYEARSTEPFFEITVRRNLPYFVPNYLFENVKPGDFLEGNMPFGNFYWEPLRDSKNIVALAGGSGVTPFYSMAKEIMNGKMKGCKLTILYGSAVSNDIVLKEELDAVEAVCPDVKVVHVISEDSSWTGEKGFITKELIQKYSDSDSTYMFCGPFQMFCFITKAIEELDIPKRRFRHDVVNNPSDVTTLPGYPADFKNKTVKITVIRGTQENVITASCSESVAVALERSAIAIDTHCRNGECGFCRSQLLSGDIFVSPIGDGRRLMDKEMGWFHACSSWPLSDLKIKIPII